MTEEEREQLLASDAVGMSYIRSRLNEKQPTTEETEMDITNTSANPTLADAMHIEASEAHGQAELVNSQQLPVENRDRELMESWGIVFGDPCEGDPIFCQATLPAGWKKRPTDHSMWSELVDDTGTVRATIFYKAAFYDRSAFMSAKK